LKGEEWNSFQNVNEGTTKTEPTVEMLIFSSDSQFIATMDNTRAITLFKFGKIPLASPHFFLKI